MCALSVRALTARFTVSLLSLLLPWALVWAQADEALATNAESAFRQGVALRATPLVAQQHFARAAELYLELHQQGVRAPELYWNLGNAAALAERWPEALWAFQLGLTLDPNHRAMRDHRDFVRARLPYPDSGHGRPETDFWPAALYRPSIAVLAHSSAGLYALAWLAGTLAYLSRRWRLVQLTLAFTVMALTASALLFYQWHQAETDRQTPLVVLSRSTPLYLGNGASYPQLPDVPVLTGGIEARRVHPRGSWLQIRLSSGEVGWVPADAVRLVLP